MINGPTHETSTRTYQVVGEGPAGINYSSVKIIADTLMITWTRDATHGWLQRRIEISGPRAKANGQPSTNQSTGTWNASWRDNGTLAWGGDTDPPEWATALALRDLPEGGPLDPVTEPVSAVELDVIERETPVQQDGAWCDPAVRAAVADPFVRNWTGR